MTGDREDLSFLRFEAEAVPVGAPVKPAVDFAREGDRLSFRALFLRHHRRFGESDADRIRELPAGLEAVLDPAHEGAVHRAHHGGVGLLGLEIDLDLDRFELLAVDPDAFALAPAGEIPPVELEPAARPFLCGGREDKVDVRRGAGGEAVAVLDASPEEKVVDVEEVAAVGGCGEIDERVASRGVVVAHTLAAARFVEHEGGIHPRVEGVPPGSG